jgi:hypothetical protein
MGKATRGVDLAKLDDIDEAQLASWMRQAAAMPFATAAQRRQNR